MLSRATSDIWTAVVNLHPGSAGLGVYLGVSQNQGYLIRDLGDPKTLRVQVPNNHILPQNLYYNYYYPRTRYLIVGYMDPLGKGPSF